MKDDELCNYENSEIHQRHLPCDNTSGFVRKSSESSSTLLLATLGSMSCILMSSKSLLQKIHR